MVALEDLADDPGGVVALGLEERGLALVLLAWRVAAACAGPAVALALALPVACSTYVLSGCAWLTTDVLSVLFASAAVAVAAFMPPRPRTFMALAARVANERIADGRYRPLTNVPGLWLLEGTLKDFARRPGNDREWTALINAAGRLPAPAGLLRVTDPAFTNPTSMRAAIDAHLRSRRLKVPAGLPGYVRLICDSLGRGHADALEAFARMTGRRFRRILMVGGGSRNRLLCQATADAAGLPVVSFALEGTAVGNLARQLIALRVVRNLPTFRRLLAADLAQTVYRPDRPRG